MSAYTSNFFQPPAWIQRLCDRTAAHGQLALTLVVCVAGALAASALHLPLAWMVGPLLLTTVVAIGGMQTVIPVRLRDGGNAVLGLLLGCSFSPDVIGHLGQWWPTLLGLAGYVTVSVAILTVVLVRVARYDLMTALAAAFPGGINEMVRIGHANGGNELILIAYHALRILIVAATIPLYFVITSGYVSGGSASSAAGVVLALRDIVILTLCVVVGVVGGRRLKIGSFKIPAPDLIGPMLVSSAVHIAGLTHASPPLALVLAAQLVVGASMGARFSGVSPKILWEVARIAVPTTALQLGITIAFAALLQYATGLPLTMLVLTYAPGGISEMSLIAQHLNQDTSFVATHHLIRVVAIIVLVPVVFRAVVAVMERRR